MSKHVKIRRGADIKLKGLAEKIKTDAPASSSYAIKPTDFHGVVPKMLVKAGAEVKAGTPIFYDKNHEAVKFVSPVSGEIAEIVRGDKRKILEVRIVPDSKTAYETFQVADPLSMDMGQVREALLNSGLWPYIVQRPYQVIANPSDEPKSIFVSAFDSAPLAPDYDFILHGEGGFFQTGLNALTKLTRGKVHLNIRQGTSPAKVFKEAKNVQINTVSGPHPAGNPGIQIHHIDPIGKGDSVWTVNPQAVYIIGKFFSTGKVDLTKTIALAGPEVDKPRYIRTMVGSSIASLVSEDIQKKDDRIISGNVLTGTKVAYEGYLGFYDDVVTVLREGHEARMFGWIMPNLDKFSVSHALFSWLMPNKRYDLNTNTNGEERAFVVTGQYEKVLPMDIYPVHLLKAILTEDVEKMENLGIYEVAPEDMALCEFACTSKTDVQKILRQGLDLAQKELG